MSESPVWSSPAAQVQIFSPQPIHKWAKGRIFFAPGGEDSISFSPSCSLLKVISETNQDSLGGSLRPFYCSEFLLNGPSHRHQSVQISLAGVITSTCFCPGIKVAWGPAPRGLNYRSPMLFGLLFCCSGLRISMCGWYLILPDWREPGYSYPQLICRYSSVTVNIIYINLLGWV